MARARDCGEANATFDTVILLAGAAVRPAFISVMSSHNSSLTIVPVETLADLNALTPDTLVRARLIAFVTSIIVPAKVLDRLGYGAYNFHPGSPSYPGWAPAHFALYARATEFGATAHVMVARVDEGPIVGVQLFPIPLATSVASLEGMAYARLAYLFWNLAKPLATSSEHLPEIALRWSGRKSTRHDYAALCDLPGTMTRDELDHRIEVFGDDPNFGLRPTIVCPA